MGLLILRSSAAAMTGLEFPQNGEGTTRFKFTSTALVNFAPATYIWKLYPIQQSGFYTTFFWGQDDGAFSGEGYYGAHPYPQVDTSVHNWEVSAEGGDHITDDNANSTVVTKGQWYTQALIVRVVNTDELEIKFYWNLSVNANRVITHTTTSDYALTASGTDALCVGDAPWSPNNELMSGIFRGFQIYDSNLSLAQVQARMDLQTDAEVISNDPGSLFYTNLNPTPSDISDKSGNGHNPAWVGANRPALWEG